jgi:hypothetical protein
MRVWSFTAAKQAGTSHLRRGERCADFLAVTDVGDFMVLAVAGGAGSARCGADGATFAALQAVNLAVSALFKKPPSEALLREVFQATLDDLLDMIEERRAAGEELQTADFHTTLLLAMLTADTLAVGNIGDGWAVVREEGALRTVAAPARNEYVNEPFFLASKGAIEEAAYEEVPAADLDALAILTDGAAWFAIDLESRTPSAPLFDKLFTFAADTSRPALERHAELEKFLASDLVTRKTDDDTSLVLAVRKR